MVAESEGNSKVEDSPFRVRFIGCEVYALRVPVASEFLQDELPSSYAPMPYLPPHLLVKIHVCDAIEEPDGALRSPAIFGYVATAIEPRENTTTTQNAYVFEAFASHESVTQVFAQRGWPSANASVEVDWGRSSARVDGDMTAFEVTGVESPPGNEAVSSPYAVEFVHEADDPVILVVAEDLTRMEFLERPAIMSATKGILARAQLEPGAMALYGRYTSSMGISDFEESS